MDDRYAGTPAVLDHQGKTFGQLLFARAADDPGREFMISGTTRLTFAEMAERVERGARALIASGVTQGDRVSIWSQNSPEWMVASLSATSIGAVVNPINTRFKGAEAAGYVRAAQPKVLFTTRGFLGADYPEMLQGELGPDEMPPIVLLDGAVEPGEQTWDDFVARGQGVPPVDARALIAAVPDTAVSDVMFSSGTTGRPKGVLTTHRQNVNAFMTIAERLRLQPGDRILTTIPFFHNFGYKISLIHVLAAGCTAVIEAVFDPERVLELVETEKVAFVPGPPAVFQAMLGAPSRRRRDLSSLRVGLIGASSIPAELVRHILDERLIDRVFTGYGLSELAGTCTLSAVDADPEQVALWDGVPVGDVELRIVGPDGCELPPGEPGEILVRSANVMIGYLDDPIATAATIDSNGWVHTGDVGLLNEQGWLHVTDRLKDVYVTGGFNVYPAEVEALLLGHPAVAQIAVVGRSDARMGEVGAAFVVPVQGSSLEQAELIAWARERMANYKVPHEVVVVDSLPMNATMKVLKGQLREQLSQPPYHAGG